MPSRRVPVALAVVLILLGCASGGAGNAAPKPLPVVHANDSQDGGSVTLRRGQRLRVVLRSTYWEFKAVSDPAVLRLLGDVQVNPKAGCVPGQGCGTAVATYIAKTRGSAVVTAERTSCGEAMGCTGPAGRYTLTVLVRAPSR